jgi:hypothetical protein
MEAYLIKPPMMPPKTRPDFDVFSAKPSKKARTLEPEEIADLTAKQWVIIPN